MTHLILNPVAGRGYARRAARELCAALDERGVAYTLHETKRPGHAAELSALAAMEGASCVWALGGDATVNETARGLVGTPVPMGVIPCGTGNDLCRVLGIPAREPLRAYDLQQGADREIDLWHANEHLLINVAGAGFDVETLVHTAGLRWLPGSMLPYFAGVLITIATHKNLNLQVTLDGAHADADFLMLSLANGRYIGGGMCVAPNALPDDGLLDVVAIRPVPKLRIPLILPKFLRGEHIHLPITTVTRVKEIHITAAQPLDFQVDGEVFSAPIWHIRPCEHKLLLKGLLAP